MHEKTGGNPFFAIQFLYALAEEGLLAFDHDAARWSWDLDRIHAKGYTDNVVDLMVGKLTRLPVETQAALQQLACLGNGAEFSLLGTVCQTSEKSFTKGHEEARQQKLFEAGVTSRDAYEQAQQAFQNAKADYQSAVEARKAGEQLLGYYTIRAPFNGVVGDIPVHIGDYVSQNQSPATVLTTVDENSHLEAYIYIPTERAADVRQGLGVNLMDNSGKLLEKTRIDFVSQEVDSTLQGILVKAPVEAQATMLRNAQLVKADVIWSTKPMAVVPVLAVTRQGEESFVFVVKQQNGMAMAHRTSVVLGDAVGNSYSIVSGLNSGDQVIVSGTQFLVDGMPVMPLGGPPQAPPAPGQGNGPKNKAEGAHAENSGAPRAAAYHPHHRRHHGARVRKSKHRQPATVS